MELPKEATSHSQQRLFLTLAGSNLRMSICELPPTALDGRRKNHSFTFSLHVLLTFTRFHDSFRPFCGNRKDACGSNLLTITGSLIGRIARAPDNLAGSYVSQHVAILRVNESLDPEFLARFLSMDEGQRLVKNSFHGQTKPGLNFDQIRAFEVPLPPISKQLESVSVCTEVSKQSLKSLKLAENSRNLFSSLQQRALRGEL